MLGSNNFLILFNLNLFFIQTRKVYVVLQEDTILELQVLKLYLLGCKAQSVLIAALRGAS